MRLFLVCHKEFKREAIERLSENERKIVTAYIVNEHYPKDWSKFTNLTDRIIEYNLKRYNSKYQSNNYFEYSAIAHLYLNPELTDGISHIGVLHSDIIMQNGSIDEMNETFAINPNTIFCDSLFRKPERNSIAEDPPLYLTTAQAEFIAEYVSERIQSVDMERIYTEGWIGGMVVASKDVFLKFGEYLEKYSDDFQRILTKSVLSTHVWANIPTALSFITERMWGFYLMSLDRPIKHMNIIHDREYKIYTNG